MAGDERPRGDDAVTKKEFKLYKKALDRLKILVHASKLIKHPRLERHISILDQTVEFERKKTQLIFNTVMGAIDAVTTDFKGGE